MKYQFRNTGMIENAELELGGLTVIAGENNTGKTYIAHSLYELQRYLLERSKNISYFDEMFFGEDMDKDMDVKLSSGNSGVVSGSIDVATITKMLNQFIKDRPSRPVRSSSSPRRSIPLLAGVSGVFSDADVVIPAKVDEGQKNDIFGDEFLSLKRKGDSLFFSLIPSRKRKEGDEGENVFKSQIKAKLAKILMRFALGSFAPPFILTAERFGISIFYKDLDFSENRRSIIDNIDYTRGLGDTVKCSPELSQVELFKYIEKMMKGSYKYDDDGVVFAPSHFIKRGGFFNMKESVLSLHETSSSICCLSNMYFYLKYMAKKNQLMIIDEPESHLDTKNQVRLARLLARCVNTGMRVLISTHSDYIIKEFNNLIMLSFDFPEKAEFLKFYREEYSNKDFLQKESTRAYVCENNTLSPCAIDNRGMDIALFDDTINKINRVSDELDNYLPPEE